MSNSLAPKLLAEFIGTFALVFIGAGAASIVGGGAGLGGLSAVAFAHGLTVLVFVCAYGKVSGGHVNPAVTRKKASTASIAKPLAGVIVTVVPPITRPCASSGVPRPVATPPNTIRNNSAAVMPPAIWLAM